MTRWMKALEQTPRLFNCVTSFMSFNGMSPIGCHRCVSFHTTLQCILYSIAHGCRKKEWLIEFSSHTKTTWLLPFNTTVYPSQDYPLYCIPSCVTFTRCANQFNNSSCGWNFAYLRGDGLRELQLPFPPPYSDITTHNGLSVMKMQRQFRLRWMEWFSISASIVSCFFMVCISV